MRAGIRSPHPQIKATGRRLGNVFLLNGQLVSRTTFSRCRSARSSRSIDERRLLVSKPTRPEDST